MLQVQIPAELDSARRYSVDVLLGEFLGVLYEIELRDDISSVKIVLDDRELLVSDVFFHRAEVAWLQPNSLPSLPLISWDTSLDLPEAVLIKSQVPVIFGEPVSGNELLLRDGNRLHLGLDVFGSAFFMLTRYEEVVKNDRDLHDRFPATASLALQEGFLDRPIIDEYLEILWVCMKHLWPNLQRKPHEFSLVLTHDVDRPFGVKGESWRRIIRRFGGDLVLRRNPTLMAKRLASLATPGSLGNQLDPNNTFDWIMDQSEKRGVQSEFYFMAGKTSSYDSGYDLFASPVQSLLRRIHNREHIIGLHPSYGTLGHPGLLSAEADTLRRALDKANVSQTLRSGRQHYLRWQADRSWADWEAAGLKEDSSVGYAEHGGFRAGTCHRYPAWSWIESRPIGVIERPLIIMERSLLSEKYMNLGQEQAAVYLDQLMVAVRKMGGEYITLWHNDSFLAPVVKALYNHLLSDGGPG